MQPRPIALHPWLVPALSSTPEGADRHTALGDPHTLTLPTFDTGAPVAELDSEGGHVTR